MRAQAWSSWGSFFFADRSPRACRTSILFSIVRVVPPSQSLRRIAILVGCSFLIMWAALIGQKLQICIQNYCKVAGSVGLSQLISQCPIHSHVLSRSQSPPSGRGFRCGARRVAYLPPPKNKDYPPGADNDIFRVLGRIVDHRRHYSAFCHALHGALQRDRRHWPRQGKSHSMCHLFSWRVNPRGEGTSEQRRLSFPRCPRTLQWDTSCSHSFYIFLFACVFLLTWDTRR